MTARLTLQDNISCIKGVGKKKCERLSVLGIRTVRDLLMHYPYRYKDRRKPVLSSQLNEDKEFLVTAVLIKKSMRPFGGRKSLVELTMRDEAGTFAVVFFNMPYIAKQLDIGCQYSVFGRMHQRNGLKVFNNPEIIKTNSENDIRGIIPVYRCTQGISNKDFIKWLRFVLDNLNLEDDWLSDSIAKDNKLCNELYAYKNIHFPAGTNEYKVARYRLIYDELLIYQIAIRKNRLRVKGSTEDASIDDLSIDDFVGGLPFELTSGQKTCIEEIEADLISHNPMNRLVQGDVGCGKTVVAEAAIYKAVKAGCQCAYMAPTEILANQHFKRISEDFAKYGICVKLLTSGMKTSDKRDSLQGLCDGSVDVVIGTHAIIQKDVEFKNLALVITDEQHRFGVNQRRSLSDKGRAVNVMVMTATPIPRTLAATVYGDMDYSIIRTLPKNRKPVVTRVLSPSSRERAYVAIAEEVKHKNRGYVLAPSIDSEDEDISSVNALYEEIRSKFTEYNIGLVHGKLLSKEKESIMQDFSDGKIDILVSTVVIEVGIDVPEATIIIIENSERFGLAQLHQLRGRVGRSDRTSYCYLINYSRSETAVARAKAMMTMSDGFEISEEDFRLRGPGDLAGTMQHGAYQSHILSLCKYEEILERATRSADMILADAQENDMTEINYRVLAYDKIDNTEVI